MKILKLNPVTEKSMANKIALLPIAGFSFVLSGAILNANANVPGVLEVIASLALVALVTSMLMFPVWALLVVRLYQKKMAVSGVHVLAALFYVAVLFKSYLPAMPWLD
ncbi:MAG: hypothetical protein LPJ89_11145 [Hymenobacteraceae bacterium]|nr:hypothetical protein [Hymenobacteraceae bacterium]MDX5397933.1 hypothetical protein [Hymenobacteraceae bacterium]MDX5444324.1 hypothetical protein [Hymenobacteraceae bacterium]MDX5514002.1 hypothetical protein [Hymenobacteraceae bacterium]